MLAGSKIQSDSSALPLDPRVVVAISICLSLWLFLIDPIINRDAILYLRTAEAYLHDGFLASFALFDRPLLLIIMALLHKLAGLSLLHCGLIFSTIFRQTDWDNLWARSFRVEELANVKTTGGNTNESSQH